MKNKLISIDGNIINVEGVVAVGKISKSYVTSDKQHYTIYLVGSEIQINESGMEARPFATIRQSVIDFLSQSTTIKEF